MSGKRKERPARYTRPQPKPASTPPPASASKSTRLKRKDWPWIAGGILVVAGAVAFLIFRALSPSATTTPEANPVRRIGSLDCKEMPAFVDNLQLNGTPAFSTSERGVRGLALLISTSNGQYQVHTEPSWSSAGNLGPVEFGKRGTIYVGPAPSINVLYNPPDEQNKVYQVDPKTAVMSPFVTLPRAGPASQENPFGVLGMSYDCETNKLYVSSVAGSTRAQQVGRLFQVDVDTAKVVSEYDNLDPMGAVVFSGAKGKRLYFGLARFPEVWSIALDDKGNFQGTPRLEISLAGLGPRGSDKARQIDIVSDTTMVVHGVEFSFNLIAPTEKQETTYQYKYDSATDSWKPA